ncbi:MAG: B12-binding domain-containing radical SAM protein [Oligoflexia bacterium]|nr:B12-binding domain-containing radical SAM protein [Oligoflexia bacterium]
MPKIAIISPREYGIPLETTSFRIRMPIYGVISLASFLRSEGHVVKVFCELSGAKVDWKDIANADYVFFSFLSFCAHRAYEMATRIKNNYKAIVVMGGSHPSVMPEDCLRFCDYVIRNEGEKVAKELLDYLADEKRGDISLIKGISYRNKNNQVIHNPDQIFDQDISSAVDMSIIPQYSSQRLWWNIRDTIANGMPRVPMPVIQASRGCNAHCKFCVVRYQLGITHRKRPIDTVFQEIDQCFKLFKNPYFLFADNDWSIDEDFAVEFFERLLKEYKSKLRPYVFARVQVFQNQRFLKILEKFEHATLGVGFESLHNENLQNFNKSQTITDINQAIATINRYKIHLNGLFIFGNDYDTPQTVRETVDYCIKNGLFSVGLFSIYDFPGRQKVLRQPQMIQDHHFIHKDFRFYNLNFVVNYPKLMRPSVLQECIMNGYKQFNDRSANSMYQFLPTRPTLKRYIEYLQKIEKNYYTSEGLRIDHRLLERDVNSLEEKIPITCRRSEIYIESGKFIINNLFRRVSWRLLIGMLLHRESPSSKLD